MQITDEMRKRAADAIFEKIWPMQEWDGREDLCRVASRVAASAALSAALSGMAEPALYLCEAPLGTPSSGRIESRPDYVEDWRAKGYTCTPYFAAPPASDLREENRWQPIKTAPKDRLIDVWTIGYGAEPLRMADCYYDRICDEWRTSRPSGRLMCIKAKYVTHWMNIPAPPAPQTEGK